MVSELDGSSVWTERKVSKMKSAERSRYNRDDLKKALRLVGLFLCDDFHLDCTNGMTLRDEFGIAIASGWNNVADFFFLSPGEQHKRIAHERGLAITNRKFLAGPDKAT